MNDLDLFEGFAEGSAKGWKQRIQFELDGADYNDSLVWESLEGIAVKPFYHKGDLEDVPVFPLGGGGPWSLAQHLFAQHPTKTNHRALGLLEKGVESLYFTLPDKKTDLAALLSEIDLDRIPLHFELDFPSVAPTVELLTRTQGHGAGIHLHLDPIGRLAREGNWFRDRDTDFGRLGEIMASAHKGASILGVDIAHYQNAGANAVQQLAYGLAHANEYLQHFSDTGSGSIALPMGFELAVGPNYFFEIAKIRALRWLWDSLSKAYGLEGDCHILARPSRRNKTLYDYNVNLLRTTSECMAAILGGADTVCNLPYDALYHKDNEFGQRLARNQLLILRKESHFDSMGHAARGSYYIETLTRQLAQKALELFKGIEASGGFLEALKSGSVQQRIKESAAREQKGFDSGQIVSLGTNTYQNSQDRMKGELQLHPFVKTRNTRTLIEPILAKRLSEGVEQKRLDHE